MLYQDFLTNNSDDASSAFFELANEKKVSFRCRNGSRVTITQDQDIEDCTGGIIWETSFLLATFLEHQLRNRSSKANAVSVLEVGAGCGLLGLVLAQSGCKVVLTETAQAMPILRTNLEANKSIGKMPITQRPLAQQLSWESPEDRGACLQVAGGPVDVIVGTDVVFAKRLVEPLLQTIHCMSNKDTVVWLCLQERCADAHAALLEISPRYFKVEDQSQELREAPGCSASGELECVLLKMSEKKDPVEAGCTDHSPEYVFADGETKDDEGMMGSPEERKRQRADAVQDDTGDVPSSHQQTVDDKRWKKKKGKAAKDKNCS